MKNKKLLRLLIPAVLFVVLLIAYAVLQKSQSVSPPEETESPPPESYSLISKAKSDAVRITIKSRNESPIVLVLNEDGEWISAAHPGIAIEQYDIDVMLGNFCYLDASDKVTDTPDNLALYKLDDPESVVMVEFKDGSSETLDIGVITPSQNEYYVKKPDLDTIYTVSKYSCLRYFYTFNDFVRKEITPVSLDNVSSMTIMSKTARYPVVEVVVDDNLQASLVQPFAGREYYLDNLNTEYYQKINQIAFRSIVSLERTSAAEYGLDDPSLVLRFISRDKAEDDYILTVGDSAGDGQVYCTYNDNPCIFTVDESAVAIWRDVNVMKTMSKFVSLTDIALVSRIELKFSTGEKHIIDTETSTDEAGNEVLTHFVDGTLVNEAAYKKFYSAVAGLSIDIEIEGKTGATNVEPVLTVTYEYNDDKPSVTDKYYKHNENFYAIQNNGAPVQFGIAKQYVDLIPQRLKELLETELEEQ